MYKLKFTSLQSEIFRFLCIKAGEKLNQREIAKSLNVSPTAISKALELLRREMIIKVEKIGKINLNLISLNRDRQEVMKLKRAENLRALYECGLDEFLENEFQGATLILFGSFSRGDDVAKSDIDIAVINTKEKEVNLKIFEKKLGRNISLNFYDSINSINKELRENICNGIVLSGGIRF